MSSRDTMSVKHWGVVQGVSAIQTMLSGFAYDHSTTGHKYKDKRMCRPMIAELAYGCICIRVGGGDPPEQAGVEDS